MYRWSGKGSDSVIGDVFFGTDILSSQHRHPRSMTKATDPLRHTVWTLPDLAEQVQQWADEEYDTIVHPALHMTPRDAYSQSMERDGERDHKRIPYDDRFKKATLPTTQKGKALVQPGKGVRMFLLVGIPSLALEEQSSIATALF